MQHHLVIVCILNKSTRHTYNTQSVWEGKIERNQENIINTKNKVRSAMPPEDVAEKTKQKRKNDYHHIHTDINAVKQGTKRNNRLTEAHSKTKNTPLSGSRRRLWYMQHSGSTYYCWAWYVTLPAASFLLLTSKSHAQKKNASGDSPQTKPVRHPPRQQGLFILMENKVSKHSNTMLTIFFL